jgi:hypothetical protein
MKRAQNLNRATLALVYLVFLFTASPAQKPSYSARTGGNPVLWEPVNVSEQDLFYGPGGKEMQPDLSQITLIKEEVGGHSKKYRIKDGSGRKCVAKIGDEAQSETAAVRLLWALGYRTEVNYLVPKLLIPGKGIFYNVRLEARPDDIKRGDAWAWGRTPFEHSDQMQGLKLMMAFLNNWDMKKANNVILKDDDERQYVISDLGVAFGKSGPVSLPLFWRIGRTRNKPEARDSMDAWPDTSSRWRRATSNSWTRSTAAPSLKNSSAPAKNDSSR